MIAHQILAVKAMLKATQEQERKANEIYEPKITDLEWRVKNLQKELK